MGTGERGHARGANAHGHAPFRAAEIEHAALGQVGRRLEGDRAARGIGHADDEPTLHQFRPHLRTGHIPPAPLGVDVVGQHLAVRRHVVVLLRVPEPERLRPVVRVLGDRQRGRTMRRDHEVDGHELAQLREGRIERGGTVASGLVVGGGQEEAHGDRARRLGCVPVTQPVTGAHVEHVGILVEVERVELFDHITVAVTELEVDDGNEQRDEIGALNAELGGDVGERDRLAFLGERQRSTDDLEVARSRRRRHQVAWACGTSHSRSRTTSSGGPMRRTPTPKPRIRMMNES